jgi:hypothetical protein
MCEFRDLPEPAPEYHRPDLPRAPDRAARQLVSKLDERQSRMTRNPIRRTVEAPGIEALCGSHKMVLRNRYLAVFFGDSRASSVPVRINAYGSIPIQASAAGQIDGKASGRRIPETS